MGQIEQNLENQEYECKICNNRANNAIIMANEMRVNTGNNFRYLQCGNCGCIHYIDTPQDMNKYYNSEYYSYNDNRYFFIKRKLIEFRNRAYSYKKTNGIGHILRFFYPMKYDFKVRIDLLQRYALSYEKPIIDVGCGAGHLVDYFYDLGYKNVVGCDPYIKEDTLTGEGNKLYKKTIFDMEEKYQAITIIHAYEHMNNPIDVMCECINKLSDDGTLIIEVPVIGYCWEKYGVDWILFDTPVHCFIYTEKSMNYICKLVGAEIKEVVYKGTDYQFRGSELIRKKVWIDKQTSNMLNKYANKKKYMHYAELLNEMRQSDDAIFVIKKVKKSVFYD